jgi:hypothetical protein
VNGLGGGSGRGYITLVALGVAAAAVCSTNRWVKLGNFGVGGSGFGLEFGKRNDFVDRFGVHDAE